MSETGNLKERIKTCRDESEKTRLRKLLNEKMLALTIILERNRKKR
jgi:hypothetical protein